MMYLRFYRANCSSAFHPTLMWAFVETETLNY